MRKFEGVIDEEQVSFTVEVRRLTDSELLREAAEQTAHRTVKNVNLAHWYRSEHSPIRTQMFWVTLTGIPQFLHTHFVRHTVWNQPFVRTGREDRGYKGKQYRWSPNDMSMLVNAQTLINFGVARLCRKAHIVAQRAMGLIKEEVADIDADLARFLVPKCIHRCGFCPEFKPCGYLDTRKAVDDLLVWVGGRETLNERSLVAKMITGKFSA